MLKGVILDVDGVIVDSPHERAWGETLRELMEGEWKNIAERIGYTPEMYTTQVYDVYVSGKPRREGARALLEYFQVPNIREEMVDRFCEAKQRRLITLIERGEFRAYDDALRFILRIKERHLKLGVASSSKNANRMLKRINLYRFCSERGLTYSFVKRDMMLIEIFDANVCGWDFRMGKPDPEIFLTASKLLHLQPYECVVVEDAPAGVIASKRGGMKCIGVARKGQMKLLKKAGADWVVETLDNIKIMDGRVVVEE